MSAMLNAAEMLLDPRAEKCALRWISKKSLLTQINEISDFEGVVGNEVNVVIVIKSLSFSEWIE